MKNLILIIAVSVLSIMQIQSQDYDFGKITKSELEEKFYPMDS